jgi:hypothetical protein
VSELRFCERHSEDALGLIAESARRDEDHDNADCCTHPNGLT